MNTNQQYLYFDPITNQWQPATLEQIVAMNDPDIGICPLNPDGTPGPQTTYAALLKKQTAQNNWTSPASATKAPKEPQTIWQQKLTLPFLRRLTTEQNLNYTLNYLRYIINLIIYLSCVSALYLYTKPETKIYTSVTATGDIRDYDITPAAPHPLLILLLGLLIGFILITTLQYLTKPSSKK